MKKVKNYDPGRVSEVNLFFIDEESNLLIKCDETENSYLGYFNNKPNDKATSTGKRESSCL